VTKTSQSQPLLLISRQPWLRDRYATLRTETGPRIQHAREVVVPVLVVGGKQVVGLDEEQMARAVGLEDFKSDPNRDGLAAPPELASLKDAPAGSTEEQLTHFVRRLQREMEFNAAKDGAPYRDGQHDGMRFARDAILRILNGTYEPEEMVIERNQDAQR